MIVKLLRLFKILRWNTWLPILAYLLFITFILSLTFPKKSKDVDNSEMVSDTSDILESKLNRIDDLVKEPQQTVILADSKHDGSNILRFAFQK